MEMLSALHCLVAYRLHQTPGPHQCSIQQHWKILRTGESQGRKAKAPSMHWGTTHCHGSPHATLPQWQWASEMKQKDVKYNIMHFWYYGLDFPRRLLCPDLEYVEWSSFYKCAWTPKAKLGPCNSCRKEPNLLCRFQTMHAFNKN